MTRSECSGILEATETITTQKKGIFMQTTRPGLILAALLTALLAACGKSADQQPAAVAEQAREPRVYSAEEFFMTTAYGLAGGSGFAFSPDDASLFIASDETGV